MIRRISSRLCPCRHWKIALCSLSTGMMVTPFLDRVVENDAARHHERLFVGQSDVPSRRNRIQGRKQAGRSDHGGDHHIRTVNRSRFPIPLRSGENPGGCRTQ